MTNYPVPHPCLQLAFSLLKIHQKFCFYRILYLEFLSLSNSIQCTKFLYKLTINQIYLKWIYYLYLERLYQFIYVVFIWHLNFFDSVYGFSFAGLKIRYDHIKADVIKVIIRSFHTPNQIHYWCINTSAMSSSMFFV